jgi:hypothetical protein
MTDRLEECKTDMKKLKSLADEIERTFTSVDTTSGVDTWAGPGADKFRAGWHGQKDAISKALHDARAEADRIVSRVQNEEDAKKKTKPASH